MYWTISFKPLCQVALLTVLASMLVSCGQSTVSPSSLQATALPVHDAPLQTTAQTQTPSSTLTFPTQYPLPDPQSYPAALASGQLLLTNDCIRLETAQSSYLIVWPTGFSYRLDTNQISILDATGTKRATIGQKVQLGGGEIPSDPAAWQDTLGLQQLPPANCPAPYWYASPDIEVVQ